MFRAHDPSEPRRELVRSRQCLWFRLVAVKMCKLVGSAYPDKRRLLFRCPDVANYMSALVLEDREEGIHTSISCLFC